ncbi:hypothetical protein C6503_17300 [Candidatus Poribacteria bacterium]|nr:MAG: hypothetical protein C6503_17300 [Candidatus Poribacteria bacterium]
MFKQLFYTTLILSLVVGVSFSALGHGDNPTLLEDVNKDGMVNIQDLVLVAEALGQPGDRTAEQNPDVNRDGIVNVLDLVRVSKSFGQTVPDENSAYHDIQEYVFDKSCASSACHAAPANSRGLSLEYGLSYDALVGVVPQNPAAAAAGMKLVDPENPDNSFLLTKLIEPGPNQGARMPFLSGMIHNGKIDAIRKWIEAGAPETGKVAGIGDLGVLRDPDEVFEPPAPPPPGQGYQIHLPPFKIEPGTEREVFYTTQIKDENGNPVEEDIFINRVEMYYPAGSHHFIIYRLTEAGLEKGLMEEGVTPGIGVNPDHVFRVLDPEKPDLLGHVSIDRLFVVGTQTDDVLYEFPEGVGLRMPGNTVYDLNSHYINLLGDETLIGETYVNIYTIPEEEVKYEAIEIFVSNRDIRVPPGLTRVSKGTWYIGGEGGELEKRGHASDAVLSVFFLSSHMHRHGELFEIFHGSTGDLLHRSIAYDDAPITLFDPVVRLDANDTIKFQCTHNNYDTDKLLEFGLTSEDEMCIIFGYYYLPTEKAGSIIR